MRNPYEGDCLAYLCASFLYYHHNESLFSDEVYDFQCRVLRNHYDELPEGFRKRVSRGDLEAGTGFRMKPEDFTEEEKREAWRWLDRNQKLRAGLPTEW